MLPSMPFELACDAVAAAASVSASAPTGEEADVPLSEGEACCMTCIAMLLADWPIFIDFRLVESDEASTTQNSLPKIGLPAL